MSLRTGLTTGTCAAAAAKAAAAVLSGETPPREVELRLPAGTVVRLEVLDAEPLAGGGARAAVRKDAGDDPDITDGLDIVATVSWAEGPGLRLAAGDGVGTVTRPGLSVPPGEPAINPVPRRMIAAAVGEVTRRGVSVQIAIPGGRRLAGRTFNPRLGIVGGLSVLGTTGIVRPYCVQAMHDAIRCALDVAAACGVTAPVLVPGNIGARAAAALFSLDGPQVVEVGNAWGLVLDLLARGRSASNRPYPFRSLLVLGHPGKLAKLAAGQWDTHSARSGSAAAWIARLHSEVLHRAAPEVPTAEGIFAALGPDERTTLANALARRVRLALDARPGARLPAAVVLVNMNGSRLGADGDLAPWQ